MIHFKKLIALTTLIFFVLTSPVCSTGTVFIPPRSLKHFSNTRQLMTVNALGDAGAKSELRFSELSANHANSNSIARFEEGGAMTRAGSTSNPDDSRTARPFSPPTSLSARAELRNDKSSQLRTKPKSAMDSDSDESNTIDAAEKSANGISEVDETAEETEKQMKLVSTQTLSELIFQYGKLSDDHPVSKYVNDVFKEALGKDAADYHITILPEWNEVNALALPDGNIIISAGILRFLKFREELKAVLAHEVMHIKRKHAEVIQKIVEELKRENTKISDLILSTIGIARLQEYEADLGWLFKEFEKRNINPLGLLSFLERRDEAEKNRGVYIAKSLIHGGLEDRALNMESVFYFLDLATLSRELGEIPAFVNRSLDAYLENGNRRNFSKGPLPWLKPDEFNQSEEKRIETAKQISTRELGFAFQMVLQFIRDYEKSPYSRDKTNTKTFLRTNEMILNILVEKADHELFSENRWPDPKRRSAARMLYHGLYIRPDYSLQERALPKVLQEQEEKDLNLIFSDSDPIQLFRDVMESSEFRLLPILAIPQDPVVFSKRIFKELIQKKKFDQNPSRETISHYVKLAVLYSKSMKNLYLVKAIRQIKPGILFENLIKLFEAKIPEQASKEKKFLREEALHQNLMDEKQSAEFRKKIDQMQEKIEQISEKIYKKIRIGTAYDASSFKDIFMEISDTLRGKDLKTAVDFFNQLSIQSQLRALKHDQMDPKDESIKAKTAIQELQRDLLTDCITFRLFVDSMQSFEGFKNLSEEAKNTLILWSMHQMIGFLGTPGIRSFELDQNSEGHLILKLKAAGEYGNSGDSFAVITNIPSDEEGYSAEEIEVLQPNDQAWFEQYTSSVESLWLFPDRTQEKIIELYFAMVEGKFKNGDQYVQPIPFRSDVTKGIFVKILAKYLGKFQTWETFFKEVRALEEAKVPVLNLMRENSTQFSFMLEKIWKSMPKRPSENELKEVNQAAEFVNDAFIRLQFQSYYYREIWPKLSYPEKLTVLFSKSTQGLFDFRMFNDFIEKEAHSKEELHAALEHLKSGFNQFMTHGTRAKGIGTIMSNARLNPEGAQSLVVALLKSWQEDIPLKEVLLKGIMHTHTFVWGEDDDDLSDRDDSEMVLQINQNIEWAEEIENALFRMNQAAKYILLRKLLTGEEGLISNSSNRPKFLKELIANMVEKNGEDGLVSLIDEVVTGLGKVNSWKPIYFALQTLIAERLAIPPEKLSSWQKINWSLFDLQGSELLKKIKGRGSLTLDQLFRIIRRKDFQSYPWRHEKDFLNYSEELLRSILRDRGMEAPSMEGKELTPLSFVIQFAQQTGALGVRFLQLLPQFADLPEKYESEFSKVYDSTYGQSKLAALTVLEREWPTFWDEVDTIEERVGGGSLMTVYKIKTKSGKEEVVKVLNPNLLYHLETNVTLITELLNYLAKEYGEKYQLANLVVGDVREWIERDVKFKDFLTKDKQFRQENDGFKPDGFEYEIYVPRSSGPANSYFMREEFIDGKNLTQWDDLKREGHDMKQIVSVIAKNYVGQLRRGFAHSDVHIGNFRVTKDKKVAILDRNFYLEFDENMKEFVDSLVNPLKLLSLTPGQVVDQLLKISKASVSDEERRELMSAWQETLMQIQKGNWKSLSKFLVSLRKNGVKLPLEMTLVFKNINSLQHMARRAGFRSLLDAYLYMPSRAELRQKNGAELSVKSEALKKDLTTRYASRDTNDDFESLDSSTLISSETRSELRGIFFRIVTGTLLAVTLNTQVAFGNLLGMDLNAGNAPIVSVSQSNILSSSIAQSAKKVLQPQVIGILPHLARFFDIVAAVIANVAGQNKIVILAETPGQVQLIKDEILAKMPESYRGNVVVETQIDREAIFGESKNTIFKPFGLPDDQSYFNEQVLKLLHDYKDRIEEKIAPREVIVGALGISDTIQTIASQAHALWFESIAA